MKMSIPQVTKAEIEDKNRRKQNKKISQDIQEIKNVLAEGNVDKIRELHRKIDGKYQNIIPNFGKSMYGYDEKLGFVYDIIGEESIKENLSMMENKLDGLKLGFADSYTTKHNVHHSSDVNVLVNNNINISISFEAVREQIEEMTSLTDDDTKEILDQIRKIEEIIKSEDKKKTKWEKLKPILHWVADKSFDVAIKLLPLILKINE